MDTDVLVIGGGWMGAAIAAGLAEGGARVVVADEGGEASVSTGGVGLVEIGVQEQPHRTVASLGVERAAALFAFARRGRRLLEERGALRPGSGLWLALDEREEAEIPLSVAALTRLGHRAATRSRDEVEATLGARFPALYLPGDATVDPPSAHRALRASAEAAGAVWLDGAAHLDESVHDGVEAVVGQERVRAELVVIAAGAASSALDPSLEGALWPVREQLLWARVDRPIGSGRAGQGWTAWRTLDDGRVLFTGCRWATPHLEVGEQIPAVVPAIQSRLEAFARERLGVQLEVLGRASAASSSTRDGLPLVGPLPGDARRIVCAGFGASPWALGMAAAEVVVSQVLGVPREAPAALASRRLVRWRRG